jgi:hypothetical protein
MGTEKPPYRSVRELVMLIERPLRDGCVAFLEEEGKLFKVSYGSANNHQSWIGGYWDHLSEVLNLAHAQYALMKSLGRELPFTLSDALFVLFWHDAEKPWKYEAGEGGKLMVVADLVDKEAQHQFRLKKLRKYDVSASSDQRNAMQYVEGEGRDFSGRERRMNELAAFCHVVDTMSARIYHAHPLEDHDPWSGTRPSTRP